jgi:hypothetical protein
MMSKRISSTLLLFAIGIGFGVFSVYSLMHARQSDDVIQACLYLVPAVVAFVALLMLPFKKE